MNSTEAKFILSAYRPDGHDATDPCFAAALALTRHDPSLDAWLQDQMSFDRAFTSALHSVAPPPELRSSILAGGGMSRRPRPFFFPRWLLAAAAVILLALGSWWMLRPAAADGRHAALAFVAAATPANFDRAAPDVAEWQAWLRTRGSSEMDLPVGLQAGMPAAGCKVVQWNGHPISIVCFRRSDGRMFHFAVSDRAAMPKATDQPQFTRLGEWATVSWSRDGKAYLLATQDSEDELRKIL